MKSMHRRILVNKQKFVKDQAPHEEKKAGFSIKFDRGLTSSPAINARHSSCESLATSWDLKLCNTAGFNSKAVHNRSIVMMDEVVSWWIRSVNCTPVDFSSSSFTAAMDTTLATAVSSHELFLPPPSSSVTKSFMSFKYTILGLRNAALARIVAWYVATMYHASTAAGKLVRLLPEEDSTVEEEVSRKAQCRLVVNSSAASSPSSKHNARVRSTTVTLVASVR
jgi:hypothetical protein